MREQWSAQGGADSAVQHEPAVRLRIGLKAVAKRRQSNLDQLSRISAHRGTGASTVADKARC